MNFFPMNLKLMTTGTAFKIKLITEKGGSQCHNSTLISWISRVRPLNPPGINPPARTKLFKLTAMIKDPARIRQVRRKVSQILFFVIIRSFLPPSCLFLHRTFLCVRFFRIPVFHRFVCCLLQRLILRTVFPFPVTPLTQHASQQDQYTSRTH